MSQGRKGRRWGGRQGGDRGEEVRPLHPRLSGGKKEGAGTKKKKGTQFRSQTVVSCYQNKMQDS